MDAEASVPEGGGSWRNVPRPTTEELLAPSSQMVNPPSIPRWVKIVGLLIVVALLLLSVWLGLSLGRAGSGVPEPTPTLDEALWTLDPPTTVEDFVRGEVTTTPGEDDGERDIVRANYTDGTETLILLLSRPEDDLGIYLSDAGVPDTEAVEGSDGIRCGISRDNEVPVCARIVDDTAIAVAGLSEQDFADLSPLLDAFYEEMR